MALGRRSHEQRRAERAGSGSRPPSWCSPSPPAWPPGVVASDLAAAWILAGTALAATLVLLAGAPSRGTGAPAWRLLGLGLGLWAGGLTAVAATFEDGVARGDAQRRRRARSWPACSSSGAALVIMALDRSLRDDWIARIDAVIVGRRRRRRPARVPLAASSAPPTSRPTAWPSGIAAGVLTSFLVGAAVRLAITGRVAPGLGALRDRGGARAGRRVDPPAHLPARAHRERPGSGRRRASASPPPSCWPPPPSTPRPPASPSASTAPPTSSPTPASPC